MDNHYKTKSEVIAEELWKDQFFFLPKKLKRDRCLRIVNRVIKDLQDIEVTMETPGPKIRSKLMVWINVRLFLLNK